MRGRFVRRIAIGFGIFFLFFVFLVGWLGATFGGRWFGGGDRHGGFFPWFPFLPILLVVVFIALGRAIRRTARPIGEVMDAAEKITDGDLSARAPIYGPSDVRNLAGAFNRMAERLETNERQRRDLLADVAHELRTPLAVIRGRVEGMRDGLYEAERGAPRADRTRDRRHGTPARGPPAAFERGGGRATPASRAARAERARRDRRGRVRTPAGEGGLELKTEVGTGLPSLDVDRVRIGEVLANLLANAVRHTPPGGTVTLEASTNPQGVAFAVTDTGEGIAADELAHVFDRFAKSPESRGAGLGLAIAKSLVQAHGGTISAESEPGRGTTIRFVLPAA